MTLRGPGRLRAAGILWIFGGILSALLVLVTLDVPATAALLAAGGVVGVVIGARVLREPAVRVVRWSNVGGVAWLVAFGWLTFSNLNQPAGEWLSGVVLTALGVSGALLANGRS